MRGGANQIELANRALRRMFKGTLELAPIGEARIQTQITGSLDLAGIEAAKAYLRRRTGSGKAIDPFERADGTAWIIVSNVLAQLRSTALALDFALEYLGICQELQVIRGSRIRKGAPHYWASFRYEEIGDLETARGHMVLAFIEDVKDHHPNARKAPAYVHLTTRLGVSSDELRILEGVARRRVEDFPMFPEEMLVDYQLSTPLEGW